ncbi:MAG: 16S rRNA (cytidine(1402)-2'-O)-methyltransferase [Puniceicoccales bacterium]|jgi:16S rRNA (cytidine1402-2'-O)-methyltransferase|nr:16S rRNA (cytidine(1402)-2'-O)-methyltransferase [Puniceicoccales bacterium]
MALAIESGDGATNNLAPGLYVVATPIGNLGDFSPRAIDTLRLCSLVACEDTRLAGRLLCRFSIGAKLINYREENERHVASSLCGSIESGRSVALISDAGTPLVSDPGFRVVRECRRRGLPVFPVPGPSAAIAALSASGLPSNSFYFLGFPPNRSASRRKFFREIANLPTTVILYESCHRICASMADAIEEFGELRTVAVGREITKLHESWHVGKLVDVHRAVAAERQLGEYVFLVAQRDFVL